jgi:F-type H+-transporting ATPase subunit a
LFMFILISNWLELIPSQGYLESPSADVNFTFALAITVIIWMHVVHIKQKGLRTYLSHYRVGVPVLAPALNTLEEVAKPITLALRLWGNIFAGGIMLAIIGLIPDLVLWVPNLGWKAVDFFIGIIQAFIFALLTILYFGFALGEEEH